MTDVKRIKSRRLHTALNGRVSWYCIPEHDHADYEAAVSDAENLIRSYVPEGSRLREQWLDSLARLRADQSS